MVRKLALVLVLACCLSPATSVAQTPPAAPPPPEFVYCPPAKFANCTTAICLPTAGGGYSCNCLLDDRYSATAYASTCVAATATTVQSRYHPIASYQACTRGTGSPRWAWCLGMSCAINAAGTGAVCDCTAPPEGVAHIPYVVTTETYLPEACSARGRADFYSSATPNGVARITAFLQRQPGHETLKPPIVVLQK